MRKTFFTSLLLAVLSISLLASCSEDESSEQGLVTTDDPALIVATTTIELPYQTVDGYCCQIAYKLQNVSDNAEISVSCVSDWVYDIDLSKKGEIDFKVTRNDIPEARMTIMTISCSEVEKPVEVTIKQEVGVPYPFDFEILDITETDINATIYPLDKETPYISFVVDSSILEQYPTDKDIFEKDMAYFQKYADLFGWPVEKMIGMYKYVGDKDIAVNTLFPGRSYLMYSYHIDLDNLAMGSEMVKYFFRSEAVPMIDAEFSFCTNVHGYNYICGYRPIDYDGWYFTDIIPGIEEDASEEEVENFILTQYMSQYQRLRKMGMTSEQILQEICVRDYTQKEYDLLANTVYLNFAVAVNEKALLCSAPHYLIFKTDPVKPSENKLEVIVTDIQARSVKLNVKTTNNDPYVLYMFDKADWEGLLQQMSEDETKQFLAQNAEAIMHGDYEEVLQPLSSNSEYVIVVMGAEAGQGTTDIIQKPFKTIEDKVSDAKISMTDDGYYSFDAVAGLDETYKTQMADYIGNDFYIFPVIINVEPEEGTKVWYGFWNKKDLDSPYATDDAIIRTLMMKDPIDASTPYSLGLSPENGKELVFTVIAQDAEGAMTPLWKGKPFMIEKAKAGDPKYFVEKYPYPYEIQSAGSVHLSSVENFDAI